VVDDHPGVAAATCEVAVGLGAVARPLTTAEQVFAVLAEGELPDVLVTDLRLPGRSGLDLLNAVVRDAPVIVITAWARSQVLAEIKEKGAFRILIKPQSLESLEAALRQGLEQVGRAPRRARE
jgi:CheY-like chemotaxis protein